MQTSVCRFELVFRVSILDIVHERGEGSKVGTRRQVRVVVFVVRSSIPHAEAYLVVLGVDRVDNDVLAVHDGIQWACGELLAETLR